MKKIYITIIVICALSIAAFFYFLPKNEERNDIYYRRLVTYENIEYKSIEGKALTLDIIQPTNQEYDENPVLVYVHGGGFTEGQKSDLTLDLRRDIVDSLLDLGYTIVSVEYRLLNSSNHFDVNIVDVKDAVRYLYSVADEYNLDTDNVGIWGNGTGAYLALTAAYSPSGLYLGDYQLRNYQIDIKYVINFSGMTEIASLYNPDTMSDTELMEAQDIFDIYYGNETFDIRNLTTSDLTEISKHDPTYFVSVDTVKTLIIHGRADEVIDMSQADILHEKLVEYSIQHNYYEILAANHELNNIPISEESLIIGYFITFVQEQYNLN